MYHNTSQKGCSSFDFMKAFKIHTRFNRFQTYFCVFSKPVNNNDSAVYTYKSMNSSDYLILQLNVIPKFRTFQSFSDRFSDRCKFFFEKANLSLFTKLNNGPVVLIL